MKNLINKGNYSPAHQKQLKSPSERIKVPMMLLLVAAFFTLCTSGSALAQWTGTGTSSNPYQIKTKADMETLATNVNSGTNYAGLYFKLMNNISDSLNTIVGNSNINSFKGHFDGNNKSLYLAINKPTTNNYVAVFGYASDGTIKNLTTYGYVRGGSYVAGIVANNSAVVIECKNYASVIAYNGFAAGIVAYTTSISNCYNYGNITSPTGSVAGIACISQEATIANCLNNGAILGVNDVGGIVARANNSRIDGCKNGGNVFARGTGAPNVGGIVGYMVDENPNQYGHQYHIFTCTNIGFVYVSPSITISVPVPVNVWNAPAVFSSTSVHIGGIVGLLGLSNNYGSGENGIPANLYGNFSDCVNNGLVAASNFSNIITPYLGGLIGKVNSGKVGNSISTNKVSYTVNGVDNYSIQYIGGIAGYATTATNFQNCYYDTVMCPLTGAVAKTYTAETIGETTNFMTAPTTTPYLAGSSWTYNNKQYPYLEAVELCKLGASPIFLKPNDNVNNVTQSPFTTSIANYVSWNSIEGAMIIDNVASTNNAMLTYCAGKDTLEARLGIFKKITPIFTNPQAGSLPTPLFSGGSGTKKCPYLISNVGDMEELADSVNNGWQTMEKYFLVTNDIGTVTTIIPHFNGNFNGANSTITVNINSSANVGLFGNLLDEALIRNLIIVGSVSGNNNVGSIAGTANNNSMIDNCINRANITGQVNVGGIAGDVHSAKISFCDNAGNITGINEFIGGIIGNSTNADIAKCTNIGFIIGNENVGGIVGQLNSGGIKTSANNGAVNGNNRIAGIVGQMGNGVIDCSINTGTVISAGAEVSAIYNGSGDANRCFYDSLMCVYKGINGADQNGKAEGINTNEMVTDFGGHDFCFNEFILEDNLYLRTKDNSDLCLVGAAPIFLDIVTSPVDEKSNHITENFIVSSSATWGTSSISNITISGTDATLNSTGPDTLTATIGLYSKRIPVNVVSAATTPTCSVIVERIMPAGDEKTNASATGGFMVQFKVTITPTPTTLTSSDIILSNGSLVAVSPMGTGVWLISINVSALGLTQSDTVQITNINTTCGWMAPNGTNELYDIRKAFLNNAYLKVPTDGATNVPVTISPIKIGFTNTEIVTVIASASPNVLLTPIGGTGVPYSATFNTSDNSLEFTTNAPLDYSTTYTVTILANTIKDEWENTKTSNIVVGSFTTELEKICIVSIERYNPTTNDDGKTNATFLIFEITFESALSGTPNATHFIFENISGSPFVVSGGGAVWQIGVVPTYNNYDSDGLIVGVVDIDPNAPFSLCDPDPDEFYNVRHTFQATVIGKYKYNVFPDPYMGGKIIIDVNETIDNANCLVKDYYNATSYDFYYSTTTGYSYGSLDIAYVPASPFKAYFITPSYDILTDLWGNVIHLGSELDIIEIFAKQTINQLTSSVSLIPLSVGEVYPMPVSDNATLDINTYQAGSLNVTLYDLTGSKVADLMDISATANTDYSIQMRLGFLPTGIYTIMISLDNNTISKQLIISK